MKGATGLLARSIDSAILAIAPTWGIRRIASRTRADALLRYQGKSGRGRSRAYDAAIRDRRTAGWNAPSSSSSAETRGALQTIRNRARELRRNSGWASKAERTLVTKTIGTGFQPKPRTKNEASSERILELWREWSSDPAQIDADGLLNFAGLQNLAWSGVVGSGETIVRRRRRRLSDGLAVPLQIQLLEGDHLDETKDFLVNTGNGNRLIQGVEVNGFGRRVAYHLFKNHPCDAFGGFVDSQSTRILARDVAHLFRVDRIGQVRGIPWGAPVFLRLKDYDGWIDAEILKQEIASTFVGFVQDVNSDDEQSPLGKQLDDEDGDEVNQFEPGTWQRLNPGESITFGKPEAFAGLTDYSTLTHREIAAGYGVTYEDLTGDYTKVNFSSGRMGALANYREIATWQTCTVVPGFCNRVWKWFIEAAVLSGKLSEREAVGADWTPPRREMIDPVKETKAIIEQVKAGLISLSEAVRQTGKTRDEILEELAQDREKAGALGLDLTVFSSSTPSSEDGSETPEPEEGGDEEDEGTPEPATTDDPEKP